MSDYGVQRCQISEVVFYTKVLVNDILVGLERILDYAGVGLERFDCMHLFNRNVWVKTIIIKPLIIFEFSITYLRVPSMK